MPQTLLGYNQQGQWPSSPYAARTSLVSSGSAGGRGGSLSAPPGCAEATTDFRLSDLEKKKRKGAIKAQLVYRTNFQSTEQPRTDLMRFAVETSCVAT